jgi:hypothetical protein
VRRFGGAGNLARRVGTHADTCFAAAPGAGRSTGAAGKIARATLLLAFAFTAHASTYYLTITGLGGEPDYTQRFKMWAEDIDGSLKKAGGDTNVTTMHVPTRDQVRARFNELSRQVKNTDSLVVMLIGHGTYDGQDYKFNLQGPDITATELASLMDHVPAQRQLVVNMTECSGGSIEHLRRPMRIVIVATRGGTERNATVFARYWAEALREPAADTDKNEAVSALEAYRYAQQKTTDFFETQKRLATEHSLIEDTGKGTGEHNPAADSAEGKVAASFAVIRLGANAAAARDPSKRPLLDRKEALEQAIDKLKFEKAAMPEAEYKRQLTQLLLELAKTQGEIDK